MYKNYPCPHKQASVGHSLDIGTFSSLVLSGLGGQGQGKGDLALEMGPGPFWQGILGSSYKKHGFEGEMQAVGVSLTLGKAWSMRRDNGQRRPLSSPSLGGSQ